jgi:1-deoxy-D-xylulose-5-phosphate synthase
MLDYSLLLGSPAMIRYPKATCPDELPPFSLPMEKGRGVWLRQVPDSRICLVFAGNVYPQAFGAVQLLKNDGIEADAYNIRFIKPVDEEYLVDTLNNYDLVVFIEEGVSSGGFGEYAAALARCRNCQAQTMVLAAAGDFSLGGPAMGTREELLRINGLDSCGIAQSIYNKALSPATTAHQGDHHRITRL